MKKLFAHLRIVRTHRKFVREICFKFGLYRQGLLHDLSKYSLKELGICRWYTGIKSPHDTARAELGFSPSWCHHRSRNKHHSEYWVDSFEHMNAVKMPYKYVVEMCADFIAASKTYEGAGYTAASPWNYWINRCKGVRIMHTETEYLFEKLLWNLHELGEREFFSWYLKMLPQLKSRYNSDTLKLVDMNTCIPLYGE